MHKKEPSIHAQTCSFYPSTHAKTCSSEHAQTCTLYLCADQHEQTSKRDALSTILTALFHITQTGSNSGINTSREFNKNIKNASIFVRETYVLYKF